MKMEWYQEAVFYEVYIRAYQDSTGDGHGDIQGLIRRLDYIQSLGVTCIWLLPMYPSPLKDDGYDVADYTSIHPDYGNLKDFEELMAACKERGLRVIIDYVPNHSSDQHEWFQQARSSKDNPYRDYYVWTDDPTQYPDVRIIFIDTETSNWTWDEMAGQYYWHRFFSSQPDLNFENEKVQEEMIKVLKFWIDMGVDGFRCDAVPYLFEEEGHNGENHPKTHQYLQRVRREIDAYKPGILLLSEACQLPHQVVEYFGTDTAPEMHMCFHFPIMPRIFLSLAAKDGSSFKKVLEDTPTLREGCHWMVFLRNHDELTLEMVNEEERQLMYTHYAPEPRMRCNVGIRRRLSPLLGGDIRKIQLVHSILFTLNGSPIIYYGDEIGMGDNIWLSDRNGVRTPMHWHSEGGFTTAEAGYAPYIEQEGYTLQDVNVTNAEADPNALIHFIRKAIEIRKQHSVFWKGKIVWEDVGVVGAICYRRISREEEIVVLHNILPTSQTLSVRGVEKAVDLWLGKEVDIKQGISLPPYAFAWLLLPC